MSPINTQQQYSESQINEIFQFFHYIFTDQHGIIGRTYQDFDSALTYLVNSGPERFYEHYCNYKAYYQYRANEPNQNSPKEDIFWIPGNTEAEIKTNINHIYRQVNSNEQVFRDGMMVPDDRPKTLKLALNIWLYVFH